MKKLFCILILLILTVYCFAQTAPEISYDSLNKTALEHLVNLINIDTAQPDPKEIVAQRYIYKNS